MFSIISLITESETSVFGATISAYGPTTKYSHWDEKQHGGEFMTCFRDCTTEFVFPVTFDICNLWVFLVNLDVVNNFGLSGLYMIARISYIGF